jgi:hypothetical protein
MLHKKAVIFNYANQRRLSPLPSFDYPAPEKQRQQLRAFV